MNQDRDADQDANQDQDAEVKTYLIFGVLIGSDLHHIGSRTIDRKTNSKIIKYCSSVLAVDISPNIPYYICIAHGKDTTTVCNLSKVHYEYISRHLAPCRHDDIVGSEIARAGLCHIHNSIKKLNKEQEKCCGYNCNIS
jgi:hypothetical protein